MALREWSFITGREGWEILIHDPKKNSPPLAGHCVCCICILRIPDTYEAKNSENMQLLDVLIYNLANKNVTALFPSKERWQKVPFLDFEKMVY